MLILEMDRGKGLVLKPHESLLGNMDESVSLVDNKKTTLYYRLILYNTKLNKVYTDVDTNM
jgi:hypothetical protein